jgi:hypothetical protein
MQHFLSQNWGKGLIIAYFIFSFIILSQTKLLLKTFVAKFKAKQSISILYYVQQFGIMLDEDVG